MDNIRYWMYNYLSIAMNAKELEVISEFEEIQLGRVCTIDGLIEALMCYYRVEDIKDVYNSYEGKNFRLVYYICSRHLICDYSYSDIANKISKKSETTISNGVRHFKSSFKSDDNFRKESIQFFEEYLTQRSRRKIIRSFKTESL